MIEEDDWRTFSCVGIRVVAKLVFSNDDDGCVGC